MRPKGPWVVLALAGAALLGALPSHADPLAEARARRAEQHTLALDLDAAATELTASDEDPALRLERGRIALYAGDYDGAVRLLSRSDVARTEEGSSLADVARGCARSTAATIVVTDAAKHVEVRFQDELDRPLVPLIVETAARSRDALARDLAVTWPRPTRITVVRDHLALSAMTGLPYQSARTTGTVAVAKWGRVTMLSPRATPHGYPWRDTLAHELTHLAVTRATVDRAPLWLQEGLAKREETRWRAPGPFDDRPPPEVTVRQGMKQGLVLPLDKLGPSIAMLPSADAATVAFAEVTSFVRFFAEKAPADGLVRLLGSLRDGTDVDHALVAASGVDLRGWDTAWRAFLGAPPAPLPPAPVSGSMHAARDAWERMRLGELLLARGHAAAALDELVRIHGPSDDPRVRSLHAHALEAAGRAGDAGPVLGEPTDVGMSFAPWWALRGRLASARGARDSEELAYAEALSADPLDAEAACRVAAPLSSTSSPPALTDPSGAENSLCDAARRWSHRRPTQD